MDTSMKVLIVDDFATMRKIVSGMLHQLGFTDITQAEDGEKAWEILQSERFGLVISDFNMPEMTGLDLLTNIRQDPTINKQKFIMLTAETDSDIISDSKEQQVDAYILKPFKIEVLQEKLVKVLG